VKNLENLEFMVRNFEDSTASGDWRSTDNKVSEPIERKVTKIICKVNYKDQGWGN
jgi:hypothetical protein